MPANILSIKHAVPVYPPAVKAVLTPAQAKRNKKALDAYVMAHWPYGKLRIALAKRGLAVFENFLPTGVEVIFSTDAKHAFPMGKKSAFRVETVMTLMPDCKKWNAALRLKIGTVSVDLHQPFVFSVEPDLKAQAAVLERVYYSLNDVLLSTIGVKNLPYWPDDVGIEQMVAMCQAGAKATQNEFNSNEEFAPDMSFSKVSALPVKKKPAR